jgi:putative transposase
LPQGDDDYSKQVGRLKVLFTRSLKGSCALPQDVCISRQRQRESDLWQRRFWEHTIRDEADWVGHINYLHYNPVKYGLVECPLQWAFSSFRQFVREGFYGEDWGCRCVGKKATVEFEGEELAVGELMGWWAVPTLLDGKQGDRPIVLILWRCVGVREAFRRKAPPERQSPPCRSFSLKV